MGGKRSKKEINIRCVGRKMKTEIDKKLKEAMENLVEQGLMEQQDNNPNKVKITEKGFLEIIRWREKNPEMDILLFTFMKLRERMKGVS